MLLMIFMPVFERYAYKFFYASLYALMVAFYASFVREHRVADRLIFLLRLFTFVYVAFVSLRFNLTFAIIGLFTIYQITRLLDGSIFKNYMMTFLIYLGVFYLSLPNHSGMWILFYFVSFVSVSLYYVLTHFAYYNYLSCIEGGKEDKETREEDVNREKHGAAVKSNYIYGLFKDYAFYIILVSIIVFIFIPRVRINIFNPFYTRFSGMSSIFSFNSIENIKESSSVTMRITKDSDIGTHYKMKSYNRYWFRRREWIATGFGARRIAADEKSDFLISKRSSEISLLKGEIVNATFYVKSNPEGYVPNLYAPLSVNMTTNMLYNDFIENIYASEAEGTIKVKSFVANPDEATLKNASGPDPQRIASYYYFMYPNELTRIRDLARRITAGSVSRYDKVMAIVNYLQKNYKYTMAVGDLYEEYNDSNYDPNEVFLFLVKAGHCEFFASSMTLMCQSLEIPARLVSGFASPEFNENGNYFLVRGSDAHAWVEVYFPNAGFVTFDPTALNNESDRGRTGFFSFFNKYIDNFNFYIENYISYYSNENVIKSMVSFVSNFKVILKAFFDSFRNMANDGGGGRDFKKFMAGFKYNMLLFSPFFIFLICVIFSARLKSALFYILKPFIGRELSYRVAEFLTFNSGSDADFYKKFAALFENVHIFRRRSETPYEFHRKILAANILDEAEIAKCKKIADLFYMQKCSREGLSKELRHEAFMNVLDIAGALKTKGTPIKSVPL